LRLKRMTETHQRKVKKGIGPLAGDKSEQKNEKKSVEEKNRWCALIQININQKNFQCREM